MTSRTYRAVIGAAGLLAFAGAAFPALAQHEGHDQHQGHPPAPETPPAPMAHADGEHAGHADHGEAGGMQSPLGPWSMNQDAGGTSWQPANAEHGGVHASVGDWMVMSHVLLNGVYADQNGPRGDSKAFVAGMAMVTASRQWDRQAVQFRVMLSPDPLMGEEGYPLLLAAGETADGVDPLVDRQHPHDLFMELSASWSYRIGDNQSLYLYGGLPGEPAFGPPAFMHRPAAKDSPEAPISHHWLDSTHITFGVLTAGYAAGPFKIEASRFRGREPDEHRYDIETGALDSTAVRLSFNPTSAWALQASWASIESPEALEPGHDERRISLSALYSGKLGAVPVNATLAWARKDLVPGDTSQAWMMEASAKPGSWTIFGRAEQVDQSELTLGVHHGPQYTVRKASIGLLHDWRVGEHVTVGLGGLVNAYDIPAPLSASYGDPSGGMVFVRLKIE